MNDMIQKFKKKNGNKDYNEIELLQIMHEKLDENKKEASESRRKIYDKIETLVRVEECDKKTKGLQGMIIGIYGLLFILLGALTGYVVYKFDKIMEIILLIKSGG